MTTSQQIFHLLQNAAQPVIVSHKSPDGDSIGSSLALYHFLRKWNNRVRIVHPDAAPEFLKWVEGSADIISYEENQERATELLAKADVIACLDFNEPGRVGEQMKPLLEASTAVKIMIDHHLHPSDFCRLVISEPAVCSTGQLIYQWIEDAGKIEHVDALIGKCIYLGMMTDTGSFRFPSVTAKTHLILSRLLALGVHHYEVHENVYDTNTIDRLRLRGYALSEKLVCLPDVPVAYIALSERELLRFNYQKGDTEGLVNQVLGVAGIKMAVLFSEKDGKIKISFRSKGDYAVNELAAAHFEGGGHAYASGGISKQSMEETIKKFVTIVKDYIPQA